MKFYSVLKTALLLSILTTIVSCDIPSKDDNFHDSGNGIAYGNIINASPDSGELDFFIGENKINKYGALSYGDVDGSFEVYTGSSTFTIKDDNGNNLASTSLSLSDGEHFSVFAINTLENIELKAYKDVLGDPSSNSSMVQFINLSPDANSISIKDVAMTYTESLDFKETTGYGAIPNGTHEFTFTNTETGEEILTASASIIAGRAYTIFTKGYINSLEGSNNPFSMQVFRHY